MNPAIFVDAKNVLYRAIYASHNNDRYTMKYHYFIIFLRFIVPIMRHYQPSSVHVFWDAPRKTVWRRKFLPTYKDRGESNLKDISEELAVTQTVAQELFPFMNVRQYFKEEMEADDLIYAATAVLHPHKSIIVSTDSDLIQIPYRFSSSAVYDLRSSAEVPIPDANPVVTKSLIGDKTDKIDGYYGIGPKKSAPLVESHAKLQEFLDLSMDRRRFGFNQVLIDLSLCPRALANQLYVRKILAVAPEFSKPKIMELAKKYKVNGLSQEYIDLIAPFNGLNQPKVEE